MNKFLMLAVSAFVFAVAAPAIAEDVVATQDAVVETTVAVDAEGDVAVVEEVCHDENENVVECEADAVVEPAVEAEAEAEAEADANVEHHDAH